MPRIIIIALVLGGAVIFILRELMKFYAGISGTRSSLTNDFKELESLVDQFELAPWQHDELDLISRNHDVSSKAELVATIEHGQFYSIFEEPIMAFATKEYLNNDRKLAVVKFNDKKYHFNVHADKVVLAHAGKIMGTVNIDNGLSIDLHGHKLHIDALTSSGLIPLSIDGLHKLSIASEDEHTGTGGRMLHKLQDATVKESELILISIAFALANKQI